jgi:para-aminobenzoate synthetase component I
MIFETPDTEGFIYKALQWASEKESCMFLNGNGIKPLHNGFSVTLAAGVKKSYTGNNPEDLDLLETITTGGIDLYGYFSYDIKNWLDNLSGRHVNTLDFPGFYFFEPEYLITFSGSSIEITGDQPGQIFEQINAIKLTYNQSLPAADLKADLNRSEYIERVKQIKQHIIEGDIYELNFCLNFSGNLENPDFLNYYKAINEDSPAPFSLYFKSPFHTIVSASPERFLKKDGRKLISQPMKGTIRRGNSESEDKELIKKLQTSEKELAENMMIVDLVRNDLARSSETGSVKVEELFGIYSFRYVHQMISTISSVKSENVSALRSILNAFPMGSMTGAPKIRAMELIDKYENSYRGAFSGAAGYFSADGNFDFNVLIRSVFYNRISKKVSISAGSAITYDSDPQKEYEECLLKAGRLLQKFKGMRSSDS